MQKIKIYSALFFLLLFFFKPSLVSADCNEQKAEKILFEEGLDEALDLARDWREQNPEDGVCARILASLYVKADNLFWAERTLTAQLQSDENDSETRLMLAWNYFLQGEPALAHDVLDSSFYPQDPLLQSRWNAIWYHLMILKGDEDAAEVFLKNIPKKSWEEEKALFDHLWQQSRRVPYPVHIRAEVSGGYQTNPAASGPSDLGTEEAGSVVFKGDVFTRLTAPVTWKLVPLFESRFSALGFTQQDVKKYSHLDFFIAPGLRLGREFTFAAFYKANLLFLNWPGRELFSEAHRAEFQLDTGGFLTMVGLGKRYFRETGRTRFEIDGALGKSVQLWPTVMLLGLATARYHLAEAEVFDLLGAGLTGVVSVRMNKSQSRTGVTVNVDRYFNSEGQRGILAHGIYTQRNDRTARIFTELVSPPLNMFEFILRYDFAARGSTANAEVGTQSYDYVDHKVTGGIRMRLNLNPSAPAVVKGSSLGPDYGTSSHRGDSGDEIIAEAMAMIQQDEAARAASSCIAE